MATLENGVAHWSDLIAKANLNEKTLLDYPDSRFLPLGPVFGVRLWKMPSALTRFPSMLMAGAPAKSTIQGLRFQGISRISCDQYFASLPGEASFVFYLGRRWAGRHEAVNESKSVFEEALRQVNRPEAHMSFDLVDQHIPLAQYLSLTRRSAMSFNAPAVHGCLGWKLGEFLALGKAIVSLPLGDRLLPAELEHGEHVHFVEPEVNKVREVIERLLDDGDYRRHLELGARRWFINNMRPAVLAGAIIQALNS